MAIKYAVDKHTRCEIGSMLAQDYGEYMMSLNITEDTDNGRIVKVGKMSSLDLWDIEEATTFDGYIAMKGVDGLWLVVVNSVADDKTALIYQQPIINEESPKVLTELDNFYNAVEDGPVRGYIMHTFDRFWLSDAGFVGTPAVGKTITSIQDGKLVVGTVSV